MHEKCEVRLWNCFRKENDNLFVFVERSEKNLVLTHLSKRKSFEKKAVVS